MSGSNLLYNFVFFFLGGLIVYVLKPFLGSYSAKKGENLATKEDIAHLTKLQEDIKAQISDAVWNRQRQWEMRRDVIFEAMRALGELDCALVDLQSIHLSQIPTSDELQQDRSKKMKDSRMRLYACETKFNGMRFLTDVVVGEGLSSALDEFDKEIRSIATKINAGDNAHFRQIEVLSSLVNKRDAVTVAARKEIEAWESRTMHSR